jgi:hypothetical protein
MSDPFVDVMGPLGVLRERIEAVFAERGLRAVHVGIVPGAATDGPHEVQVLALLADDPPPDTDDEFKQVINQARDAEVSERARAAFDDLQARLRGGKGFLDDSSGDE